MGPQINLHTLIVCEKIYSRPGYTLIGRRKLILPPYFEAPLFRNLKNRTGDLKDVSHVFKLKLYRSVKSITFLQDNIFRSPKNKNILCFVFLSCSEINTVRPEKWNIVQIFNIACPLRWVNSTVYHFCAVVANKHKLCFYLVQICILPRQIVLHVSRSTMILLWAKIK